MTPVSVPNPQLTAERQSAVLTVCLLLIALLLGWQVKTAVQNASRTIEQGGFMADVPPGWLVQPGAGDLVVVARNPQALNHLYRVSQLPAASDLDSLAENRNLVRIRLDSSYRVLDASPVIFDGRDGYKINFARVDLNPNGLPQVIEGIDYYFAAEDRVIILSLEARSETFATALPAFQRFMQSVTYQSGE